MGSSGFIVNFIQLEKWSTICHVWKNVYRSFDLYYDLRKN
jgi:hypothetical protein